MRIDAPTLGDATAAFKSNQGGAGREMPKVTYAIVERRGQVILTTEDTDLVWLLDSPSEASALAARADSRAAAILIPR